MLAQVIDGRPDFDPDVCVTQADDRVTGLGDRTALRGHLLVAGLALQARADVRTWMSEPAAIVTGPR